MSGPWAGESSGLCTQLTGAGGAGGRPPVLRPGQEQLLVLSCLGQRDSLTRPTVSIVFSKVDGTAAAARSDGSSCSPLRILRTSPVDGDPDVTQSAKLERLEGRSHPDDRQGSLRPVRHGTRPSAMALRRAGAVLNKHLSPECLDCGVGTSCGVPVVKMNGLRRRSCWHPAGPRRPAPGTIRQRCPFVRVEHAEGGRLRADPLRTARLVRGLTWPPTRSR
jgi:hypothetical protein